MHAEQQSLPKVNLYSSKTLFEKKNSRNQKRFAQMLKRKTALSIKTKSIKSKKFQISSQNNNLNRVKTISPIKNKTPLRIKIITQTEKTISKKEELKNNDYNNEVIINISPISSSAKNENSSKISNILNENNNNNSSTNNSNNNSCTLKDSKEKEINISTLENASEEELIPNLNNENNNINDEEDDDNNLRNKINNLYDYDNDDSISRNINTNNNQNSKIKEENQFALKYLSSSSESFVQLDNNLVTRVKYQNNHFTESYFQALFPQLSLDDNHKIIKDKNYNVSEIIKEEKEIETPLRIKKDENLDFAQKNKQKKYNDYYIKRNCKKNFDTENKTIHESFNENLNSFISFNSTQNLSMSAVILNNKKNNNTNTENKLIDSYKKKYSNENIKNKNNKINLLKKNLKLKKCLTKNILRKNKKSLHYMYSANLSIKKHLKKEREMNQVKNSLLSNYKKNLSISSNKSKIRLKFKNSSCITDTSSIKNNTNANGHHSVLNFREKCYNYSIDRVDKINKPKKQISFFDKNKKYGKIIDTNKINKHNTANLINLKKPHSTYLLNFNKERPSSTKNSIPKKSIFNLYFSSSKILIKQLPNKKKRETDKKRNKVDLDTYTTKSKESMIINTSSLINLNTNSIISQKTNLYSNKKPIPKKSKFTLINKKCDYSHIKPKVETNLNNLIKKNKNNFNKSTISCKTTKDKTEEERKKINFKKKKSTLYKTVMNFKTTYRNVNVLKNDKIKTESKLLLNKNDNINKSCRNFRKKLNNKGIKPKNGSKNN